MSPFVEYKAFSDERKNGFKLFKTKFERMSSGKILKQKSEIVSTEKILYW